MTKQTSLPPGYAAGPCFIEIAPKLGRPLQAQHWSSPFAPQWQLAAARAVPVAPGQVDLDRSHARETRPYARHKHAAKVVLYPLPLLGIRDGRPRNIQSPLVEVQYFLVVPMFRKARAYRPRATGTGLPNANRPRQRAVMPDDVDARLFSDGAEPEAAQRAPTATLAFDPLNVEAGQDGHGVYRASGSRYCPLGRAHRLSLTASSATIQQLAHRPHPSAPTV